VGLIVALADVVIYRGSGFAGYAALFAGGPLLLTLGCPRVRPAAGLLPIVAMLILLALRMVWLGSNLGLAAGFVLLVAFAMAVSGRRPYVLDIAAHGVTALFAGCVRLVGYGRFARVHVPKGRPTLRLAVVLPLAVLMLFGTIFVLANPDLATRVLETAEQIVRTARDWCVRFAPRGTEIMFWIVAACMAAGLLRPIMRRSTLAAFDNRAGGAEDGVAADAPARVYPALRNTLAAVIVLFAVYLAFEFATLWFRDFPPGFYYAGYAHEGAAWLTVALALATAVLSLAFRGAVLRDPRIGRLRWLAWVWSAENVLLAIAVYNRLFIYIGYNGMTRLRTVALFGTSVVVAGFALVVWKVARNRDFVWVVRRQLWALALTIYLFALTPVDAIVHSYNVRKVLAGYVAPAVQVSVQPIDAEGVLVLHPLVECEDLAIQHGIRALLAERALVMEKAAAQASSAEDWTAYQGANRTALDKLNALRDDWREFVDPKKRKAALERFHDAVAPWY
jgi:hypothetical protein